MTQFDVAVSREDGFWVGKIAGVRGGATEARRLSSLEAELRDLLVGLLDVEEEAIDFRFDFHPAIGEDASKQLFEYREARYQLDRAQSRYEHALSEAALKLRDAHISLRDSAELLQLSHQRIHQILDHTH